MKKYLVGVAALALVTTTHAEAATYAFTLGSSVGSGSGTFTTDGDADTGFALINALTGSFNGNAMSLLASGTYPTGVPNDNLFTALAPYFTYSGISFTAGASFYNLYNYESSYYLCYGVSTSGCFQNAQQVTFSATEAPAVPEPATWAMLLLGFGAIGSMVRYRKRKVIIRYA